jgi:hypothetical protein
VAFVSIHLRIIDYDRLTCHYLQQPSLLLLSLFDVAFPTILLGIHADSPQ